MTIQCMHSDNFDPNNFNVISGPYVTQSGCLENCICSGVDCGPSGIDPVTCECVPPPNDPPDPDNPPVIINCSGIDSSGGFDISGVVVYFPQSTDSVTVLGQTFQAPCYGGHCCNRGNFIPKLTLPGVTISANEVSIDNYFHDSWDCWSVIQDGFVFNINNADPSSLNNAQFELSCNEPNNNCHFGVAWVALVAEDLTGNQRVIWNGCVFPNDPLPIDVGCGSLCEDSESAASDDFYDYDADGGFKYYY